MLHHWIALVVAGLLEIGWAAAMKASEGFTRLVPSLVTVVVMVASFGLLAYAMKALPMGTSYAVWTGIGAVGAALVGIFVYGEAATPLRLLFLAMIAGGILGLKFAG